MAPVTLYIMRLVLISKMSGIDSHLVSRNPEGVYEI